MLSRRAFLGVSRPNQGSPVRPPWALAEAQFLSLCTRCNACIDACPTGLLKVGEGGFPEADFTPGQAPAGCTFCGDCRAVCTVGALAASNTWVLKASFSSDCLAARQVVCRTCAECCEFSAIHFPPRLGGVAQPSLDDEACTGCGACLADCPTRAIRVLSVKPTTYRGAA